MSYLGSSATPLPVAFAGVNGQSFNGGTNTFTLSRSVSKNTDIEVVINNVQQNPYDGSYSVNGTTLTTAETVSAGVANVYVIYRDAPIGSFAPIDGSVTPTKLSTGAPTWDINGSVGFGTSTPASDSLIHVFAATDKARVSVQRNGVSKAWFGQDGGGDAYIYNEASGAIRFYTGSIERARITTGGQRQSTIIGGGGPMWDAFDCRAWVNFNGTGTVAIRASGNVSSITDLGTGNYRMNLTTAMPDSNFNIGTGPAAIGAGVGSLELQDYNTSSVSVITRYSAGGAYDWASVFLSIHR